MGRIEGDGVETEAAAFDGAMRFGEYDALNGCIEADGAVFGVAPILIGLAGIGWEDAFVALDVALFTIREPRQVCVEGEEITGHEV